MQAVALIDGLPARGAQLAVLAGPPGSGKSHLLAIWRDGVGAFELDRRSLGAAAVDAAEAGPVVLDDADAEGLDENGLFHVLNAARAAGNPVLLTSRRFPAAWGVALPDLASRLKAGALVELGEPDDLLLAGVITKLFADRQVEVEQAVVQFLVRRIERSLSTAIGVVERLDRRAMETKSRITRQLAAGVMESVDAGQGRLDL